MLTSVHVHFHVLSAKKKIKPPAVSQGEGAEGPKAHLHIREI